MGKNNINVNGVRHVEEAMLDNCLNEQHLFINVFENAPIGMLLVAPDGRFMKVNQSLCRMLGYTQDELLVLDIESITYPDDLESNLVIRRQAFSGKIDSYQMEKRYIHKSGQILWGFLTVTAEKDAKGEVKFLISQITDITKQKMEEENIRKAEKLSVLGELAAGIAHEIRNPLTSLRGFVQLYQAEDIVQENQVRHDVMLAEIDRINDIVSELLVLAKPTKESYELRSISKEINHVVTLLQSQANLYNVQIVKEMDSDLPRIYCQSSIKQVFINLLKNAIESMPDGGEVCIRANQRGQELVIQFIDQGVGIPIEKLPQIGNPFYTTKENGTGLGLMVSQRIIQNHKGTIRIKSEEGISTMVEIGLPVSLIEMNYLGSR